MTAGNDSFRLGKFDRVRVNAEGPDVILELPKNPARCHWTDMAQIVQGLNIKIKEAYEWEQAKQTQRPSN